MPNKFSVSFRNRYIWTRKQNSGHANETCIKKTLARNERGKEMNVGVTCGVKIAKVCGLNLTQDKLKWSNDSRTLYVKQNKNALNNGMNSFFFDGNFINVIAFH